MLIPHTHLRLNLANLLLLAFERLYLLQPTEAPPGGAFKELVDKGVVKIICPPPLGEKLVWFEQLITAYEEWGNMMRWPENVSLFKARPEVLEETVSEIKAAILGKEPQKEDPVFKARVILQLAQNLDQRLEELDFEYEFLKEQANKLANFILGHDPTVRRFENWVTHGIEISWELPNVKERLMAAARLLLMVQWPTNILVTDQIEVTETLLDLAPQPQRLGQVSLPSSETPNIEEKKHVQEKIRRVLGGFPLWEEERPSLEWWSLPVEGKSLLAKLLNVKEKLKEGRTFLAHLHHV